ncbi:MAG: hypothetical protein FWE85_01170 [Clostridiales bacterium]|nr:hypothetical protein [Clostridiales bacterium]
MKKILAQALILFLVLALAFSLTACNTPLITGDPCGTCGKEPCECPAETCTVCGKEACECPVELCPLCGVNPCECPGPCPDCGKSPCICPPPDPCDFCGKYPCECPEPLTACAVCERFICVCPKGPQPTSYGEAYINYFLPFDYYIAYSSTDFDVTGATYYETAQLTKTLRGYYVICGSNRDLFIINKNKSDAFEQTIFDWYRPQDEGFRRELLSDILNLSELDITVISGTTRYLFGVPEYMRCYVNFAGVMASAGSGVVAGRNCDIFTYTDTSYDIPVSFKVWIDKETGICLKRAFNEAAGAWPNVRFTEFECTEFRLTNVNLPDLNPAS